MTPFDPAAEADDGDYVVNAFGVLLTIFEAHERDGGQLHDQALFDALAEVLDGDDREQAEAAELSEERRNEVRRLVAGLASLIVLTGWSPADLRIAIGCAHSADELFHHVALGRCLALTDLLSSVVTEVGGGPDEARATVVVAVNAFRAAQGDPEATRDFWERPLKEGGVSARDLMRAGREDDAYSVVVAHGMSRPMRVPRLAVAPVVKPRSA